MYPSIGVRTDIVLPEFAPLNHFDSKFAFRLCKKFIDTGTMADYIKALRNEGHKNSGLAPVNLQGIQ